MTSFLHTVHFIRTVLIHYVHVPVLQYIFSVQYLNTNWWENSQPLSTLTGKKTNKQKTDADVLL